jgi:ATP-dependent DNA ligase
MSCLHTQGISGHIDPCLPSPAERPPSGDGWIHEIKHDGLRIMARRDSAGVRLFTRHGNGSPYRSGRSRHWLKIKNPKAPAVKRETEEGWGSAHWIKAKHPER